MRSSSNLPYRTEDLQEKQIKIELEEAEVRHQIKTIENVLDSLDGAAVACAICSGGENGEIYTLTCSLHFHVACLKRYREIANVESAFTIRPTCRQKHPSLVIL